MFTFPVQGTLGRTCAAAILAAASVAAAVNGPAATAVAWPAAHPGIISTVAGGTGGTGKATTLGVYPEDVAVGDGSLYIASGDAVHKVDPGSDQLTTPVGAGGVGPSGFGRPATDAILIGASDVVASQAGNLVVDEPIGPSKNERGGRLQLVPASTGTFFGQRMTARHIYNVAGNGQSGFSGDGGPATKAKLNLPSGALDATGNLVIADYGNNRIRVVAGKTGTFYGQPMTAGDIYTVAGNGTSGFSGDGGPATQAELAFPGNVAVDGAGNLVIVDSGNERIRVVAASTGTFYGQPMTEGDIYTVAGDGGSGFSGDGGPATRAEFDNPVSVAVDGTGNLLVADQVNDRVRAIAVRTGTFYGVPMTAGDIYTVAGSGQPGFSGDGGPATGADLDYPAGVAVDGSGNLVIADVDNYRVRVVAGSTGTFYGQPMTEGDIYTVAGAGQGAILGDGGLATNAKFFDPAGVSVDTPGNLLIADDGHARVRVVAGSTGTFYGQPMTVRHIYTVAGDGRVGFSGDGGPATQAAFYGPEDVVADVSGNLLIADAGNGRVRVVAARDGTFYGMAMTAGDVYTVAGGGESLASGVPATHAFLYFPSGVAADSAGNLLLADDAGNRVRVVAGSTGTFYGVAMTAGDIYTIAGTGTQGFSGDGGPATKAKLYGPASVALDAAGNVLIADDNNQRVRVVAEQTGTFYGQPMTAGDIYTVAGDGTTGFSGDGGPAIKAAFHYPAMVVADGAGNLVIADSGNNRVRVVAGHTGTFYGVPMTAGNIYTVAGTGARGYDGDGVPGVKAELNQPLGVGVDGAGDLLIADYYNQRIREVAG